MCHLSSLCRLSEARVHASDVLESFVIEQHTARKGTFLLSFFFLCVMKEGGAVRHPFFFVCILWGELERWCLAKTIFPLRKVLHLMFPPPFSSLYRFSKGLVPDVLEAFVVEQRLARTCQEHARRYVHVHAHKCAGHELDSSTNPPWYWTMIRRKS